MKDTSRQNNNANLRKGGTRARHGQRQSLLDAQQSATFLTSNFTTSDSAAHVYEEVTQEGGTTTLQCEDKQSSPSASVDQPSRNRSTNNKKVKSPPKRAYRAAPARNSFILRAGKVVYAHFGSNAAFKFTSCLI